MTNSDKKTTARRNVLNSTQPTNQAPRPYLEFEETMALSSAATNLRDRLLINLLIHTGVRISEAMALKVDDINFNDGTVTIRHLKASIRLSCPNCNVRLSKTAVFCPGCGERVSEAVASHREHRRLRTIPIDQGTLGLLREYIDRGGVVEKNGQKLIFGINRHRAWQIVRQCAIKAGLPLLINPQSGRTHNVSPHRLRDCFSIRAVKKDDSGDSLRMLQEHLGHQNINTTMGYRKVAGDELKKWYQRLWSNDT